MWKKSLSLTLAALFGCAALGLAATPAVMPAAAVKPLPVQTSQPVDAVASASIPDEEVTPETPKDTQETKEKDTTLPASIKHLDLVLILDKSGSMKGLEKNTIDGYNTMLAKERKLSVPTEVTTVLFSSNYEILTDRQPIAQVSDMSEDTYTVRGATALYDAVGMAIDKMDAVKGIHDPGHQVLFVIITDGLENYSQKYDQEQIKKKIDAAQEQGWEFVFIGANMDAEKVASDLGIKEENAATYENSEKGVQANYKAVSQMVESLARTSSLVGSQWKNSIVRGN